MKKINRMFAGSCTAIALSAFSIWLIPLIYNLSEEKRVWPVRGLGLFFWMGLIIGYGLQENIRVRIRRYRKKKKMCISYKRTWGIKHVFSNLPIAVVDVSGIILLVSLILIFILGKVNDDIFFIVFGGLLFCVQMHCILNGSNYFYIRIIRKEQTSGHE